MGLNEILKHGSQGDDCRTVQKAFILTAALRRSKEEQRLPGVRATVELWDNNEEWGLLSSLISCFIGFQGDCIMTTLTDFIIIIQIVEHSYSNPT